jgi:YD repeat-containing protein
MTGKSPKLGRSTLLITSLLGLFFLPAVGFALGVIDSNSPGSVQFLPQSKERGNDAAVETVDPQNGDLWVKQKDVVMKGSGGLDLTVWRTYSMMRASAAMTATLTGSYRWAQLGPGWSIEVAPKLRVDNVWFFAVSFDRTFAHYRRNLLVELCTTTGSHADFSASTTKLISNGALPVIEYPDGSVESIYGIGNHEARTKSNWKIQCLNNNVTATSPSGVTYDYGEISERRIGTRFLNDDDAGAASDASFIPPRSETYMVAKTATDLNGNQLAFSYISFGTPIPPWTMPDRATVPNVQYLGSADLSWLEHPATLLSKVVASDGRVLDFLYDSATGRLSQISNNQGLTIAYGHQAPDSQNSRALTSVTYNTGEIWKYDYHPGPYTGGDYGGIMSTDTPTISARKIRSITYPSGGVSSIAYTFTTHQVGVHQGNGSYTLTSSGERVLSRSLSTGEIWTYEYQKGTLGEYDVTKINGPEGQTTLKYIGPSYKASTDSPLNTPAEETVWSIGGLKEKTDPLGNVTSYAWQPRTITAGKDVVVDLGYAMDTEIRASDLQVKTEVRDGATYVSQYSDYDAYGNPGTRVETGPNGETRTTTYTYFNDPTKWILGKVASETSPGKSLTRTFDANGNVLTEARDGVTTSFTYDSQGNMASKTTPSGGVYTYSNYKLGVAQSETRPENITITRIVDDAGNVTSQTNGEGHTTLYTYDGLNRVTSIAPPVGNPKTIVYTPTSKTSTRGPLIETTQYDPFGRIGSITQAGITRTFTYDGLNRKTFESNPGATTGTSYQYDALNRLTRQTNADNTFQTYSYGPATTSVTDERGNLTTYSYRSYGDPNQHLLMAITAPEVSANVTIERGANDLMTSVTQAGLTRTYGYDSHNYLVSVSNPETGVTAYGRDIAGNMTSKQVGTSGVTQYTYDTLDRLISTTYPGATPAVTNAYNKNGKLLSSSSAGGNRTFAYDASDNLVQDSLALDGLVFTTQFAYDGNDSLNSITYPHSARVVNYAPDALGRPTSISGYVSDVKYWPSGLIQSITYNNGTVSSYGQDSRLWPASFTTQNASTATTYLNSAYTYDGIGNLVTISDNVDASFNRTLGYDGINRLTSVTGFWGEGSIAYDGGGNLTNQTLGQASLAYTYDANNRLSSVSGLRTDSYGYDVYGNVSSSQSNTYTYDDVPNLTCINCANPATKVEYSYDGLNHRSSVTKASGKVYEMHDSNGKQLIEWDGGTLTEYFYLGDKRVAQQVSP